MKNTAALKLDNQHRNSAGSTAANSYASETWSGQLGSKTFSVTLTSTGAPVWDGDELDQDEQTEVMNELAERSGL